MNRNGGQRILSGIVGIVALSAGRRSIPTDWLKAREPIQI